MTQLSQPAQTALRRFLRPRSLIVGALAVIVSALLLRGLLTPAPSHPATAHATPAPAAPIAGHYAPAISAVDLSGNPVTLASLRGKVVALNFWYVACDPCKIEMPALQRSYDKFKSQGFVVLGIDIADDTATAGAFIREVGITYPVVRDQSLLTATNYDLTATPSTFFIDRDGVIRAKVAGPLDIPMLDANITALLHSP
jgi:cytochrome c biogenesis protein CcmG, thiol:disulfide interchange protein DsbE